MKRYLALAVLLLIPFAYYLFLRSDLVYYDSYHYACLACACDQPRDEAPLAFIFQHLPCNRIVFILLLYACALASIFLLEKTHRCAGFFAFLVPAFLLEFFRFENDTLAYPFLFAAVFAFFEAYKHREHFHLWQGLSVLFTLAACGFWGGALFLPFLLSVKKDAWAMRGLALLFAVFFGAHLLTWFAGSIGVHISENMPFMDIPFLMPALLLAPFGWKKDWHNPAWYALALSLIKPKLVVFSLIFIPIGIAQLAKKYPRTRAFLLIAVAGMLFMSFRPVLVEPPSQSVHSAIGYALQIAPNRHISNDWDIGYIVKWHGGKTNSFGTPIRQKEYTGATVSREDLNCAKLKQFGKYAVWWCK